MITSTSNAQVKKWVKLITSRAQRQESNTCIIEGSTLVREASTLGLVETVIRNEKSSFTCDSALDIPIETLSTHCFKKISHLQTGEVMAVVRLPQHTLDWASYRRILICDQLQNPNNLGALIRTAHAASFDCLITTPGSADFFNPKTVRASTGSALRFPCFQIESTTLFEQIKAHTFTVLGLAADGEYQLFSAKPQGNIALIVGNEGHGLSPEVATHITARAALPINPEVESLNAAVAASIAMYQITWG